MAALTATVFGASGFVGGHLVRHLSDRGYAVRAVARGDANWRGADLGHAFYCIGLTADFRSRPFETVEAHVTALAEALRGACFASFTYLSSTRVYARATSTDEVAAIPVSPAVADDLYNVSKLMGEALCLSSGLPGARVARLSNVFGCDLGSANFLTSVIREAVDTGAITLGTSLASEKDYIAVEEVCAALEAIATRGRDPIVNVAAGANAAHAAIVAAVSAATGAAVSVAPAAPTVRFPRIETARLDGLIGSERRSVIADMPRLVAAFAGG